MDVLKVIPTGAPAPSPSPDGAVTVRLDREDAGRLSKLLLDLLAGEAVAAIVTPTGFDEQATITVTLAQLRHQLRDL